MLRRLTVARTVLTVLTVLLILLIPSVLLGCQEKQDRRDYLKVADTGSTTVTAPAVKAVSIDGKSVEKETLSLENDLDSLSADINDFGDFGLDSAASAIDRELDGF